MLISYTILFFTWHM